MLRCPSLRLRRRPHGQFTRACAHHRIHKPARTIAALESAPAVRQHHVMEAPACRNPARLPDIVTDAL